MKIIYFSIFSVSTTTRKSTFHPQCVTLYVTFLVSTNRLVAELAASVHSALATACLTTSTSRSWSHAFLVVLSWWSILLHTGMRIGQSHTYLQLCRKDSQEADSGCQVRRSWVHTGTLICNYCRHRNDSSSSDTYISFLWIHKNAHWCVHRTILSGPATHVNERCALCLIRKWVVACPSIASTSAAHSLSQIIKGTHTIARRYT